jgi:hypothetical protein
MTVGAALKYVINYANRARQQEGWPVAVATTAQLLADEAMKVPRLVSLQLHAHESLPRLRDLDLMSKEVVEHVLERLTDLGVGPTALSLDREALLSHMKAFDYPRFYGGGSASTGGVREKKIIEYFVSLVVVPVNHEDVVIDVASERSVFPDVVRTLGHASVFRQDLIYPRGVRADRIGGNAADMPIEAQFASKLFLHNSFEHFEGDTDTSFVREAWRVLKPGGAVCILPLFLSDSHRILTDPLTDRDDIDWDPEASVIPTRGYRNRFGRFYSPETLRSRVIVPARECGFEAVVYHFENVRMLDPTSGLHFGLVLEKPDRRPRSTSVGGS